MVTLLISCVVLAAVGLAFATHGLTGELTTRGACRDLAGFFGLALLGAALLGAGWYWTLPVLAAMVPLICLPRDGLAGLLTWPLKSDQSSGATATALTLLITRFFSLAMMGTQPATAEGGFACTPYRPNLPRTRRSLFHG